MSQRARILVAEAIGTAILVLGGPGTVIFAQFLGFNVGVLGVALAFGLSLLCAVYLFGEISGCHINPAVTVAMWVLKRTATKDVPWYIGGQIIGAALASGLLWAMLETGGNAGTVPGLARSTLFSTASNGYGDFSPAGFELGSVIIAEVLFTALFVLVIIGVTRSSMPAGFAAIPIGLMLTLVHLISIPIDNTSVNPARSFATAIFAKGDAFEQLWVFIVFPVVGAVIAACTWSLLAPSAASTRSPAKAPAKATKKPARKR